MKITDEKLSSDYTNHLQRKRLKEIASREKEVKNLGVHYDKQVAATRLNQERELSELELLNRQKLQQASSEYQKGLDNLKKSNELTASLLDREKNFYIETHKNKMNDLDLKANEKHLRKLDEIDRQSQSISESTESKLNKHKLNTSAQLESVKLATAQDLKSNELKSSELLFKTQSESDQKLRQLKNEHRQIFALEKMMQDKELANSKQQAQILTQDTLKRSEQEIANIQDRHKNLLTQEQTSFAQKMNILKESHEEILNKINDHFKETVQKTLAAQAQVMNSYDNKNQDSFYSLELINPEIHETPEEYIVKVPVADYEKDLVQLVPSKKSLRLSFAKRFSEQLTLPDGSQNQTKRSENYSKEIPVANHLLPRSMTRTFENGILTFRVKKDS